MKGSSQDLQLSSATDALQKDYVATVLEAVSGDCAVLLLGDDSERRVYLASIRCPRPGGPGRVQSKEEETLAFEARELVRKKAVGKKVRVRPSDKALPRRVAKALALALGGERPCEALVAAASASAVCTALPS